MASTFQLEFWKDVQNRAVVKGTIGWVALAEQSGTCLMRWSLGKDLKEAGGSGCMHAQLPRGQHLPCGINLHRYLLEWVRKFPWSCLMYEDIRSQRNTHGREEVKLRHLAWSPESPMVAPLSCSTMPWSQETKALNDTGFRSPFPSAFHAYIVS